MMRLLIDRGNAPPKTGIGIYSDLLVAALKAHCQGDIEVIESEASIISTRFRPLARARYLVRLHHLRAHGFDDVDVVHFTNQYAPKELNGLPYVLSIHDLDPLIAPEVHTRRYAFYFRNMVRRSVARSQIIVTPTEAVKNDLVEHIGLEETKVHVIGQGLSDEFMKRADQTKNSNPRWPILLYVGQVSMKKNIAWIVGAIDRGIEAGTLPRDLQLIVAGGRGYGFREFVREKVRAKFNLTWLVSPPLSEIIRLYASCTAVLLPSLREGFGRPILESMFIDKPLVASRIPSTVEVAGESGYYFDLGNEEGFHQSVNEALHDVKKETRKTISCAQLRKFSWERLARMYLDVYQKLQ